MAGLNDGRTRSGMDQKRNGTIITQDTRLVPPSTHNVSHHQSVGFHANMSHKLSHNSSSLSQKSPVSDTVRVKRYLYYPILPAYNPYYPRPDTTTTTIAPWIQSYNDTHHFKVNYTHKQIAETPLGKANVTTLGFSKDTNRASILFLWHKEKHNKCENYKKMLDKCVKNNFVSLEHVDSTSLVDLLRQEEALGKDRYPYGCSMYKSLMSICHAENIFPNEHIDSSKIWVSMHDSKVNGSDFYYPEQALQPSSSTSGQLVSGIY